MYIYIYKMCIYIAYVYIYIYCVYIYMYMYTLSPLCGYDISTRRRRQIPKTDSEDEFPEDELPPEDELRRRIPRRRIAPAKTNSPPEDELRRRIPRRRIAPEDDFPPRRRFNSSHICQRMQRNRFLMEPHFVLGCRYHQPSGQFCPGRSNQV